MRTKVTFAPNIPTQVILDGPGELQPSKSGTDEYRYFLANDRIMWVPPEVHQQIERAQAQEGDMLTITRVKGAGKTASTWQVEHHAEEPAAAAVRATSTAQAYRQPSPQQRAAARPASPPENGYTATDQPAQTRILAELPVTAADRLAGALAAAIDAAAEASTYAQRRGLILAWNAGDIRALAATLYIEHRTGGR